MNPTEQISVLGNLTAILKRIESSSKRCHIDEKLLNRLSADDELWDGIMGVLRGSHRIVVEDAVLKIYNPKLSEDERVQAAHSLNDQRELVRHALSRTPLPTDVRRVLVEKIHNKQPVMMQLARRDPEYNAIWQALKKVRKISFLARIAREGAHQELRQYACWLIDRIDASWIPCMIPAQSEVTQEVVAALRVYIKARKADELRRMLPRCTNVEVRAAVMRSIAEVE